MGGDLSRTQAAASVLADPAASFALKDVLRVWLARDPVDAANDAEILVAVLCRRGVGRREGEP